MQASPEFRSKLIVEVIADEQFKLLQPLRYYSVLMGEEIVVPEGFVTDFASVPRIPPFYDMYGGKACIAATVHDYLCDQSNEEQDRAKAHKMRVLGDDVFLEAMQATGIDPNTANPMHQAVSFYTSALFEGEGNVRQ